jgi:hypothetical protein
LALDAGLLLLKGMPGQALNDSVLLSSFLLEFVDALVQLSETDIAILRAVSECGSFKAAARKLAPGRPSYRSYIQQRFKTFREISGRLGRKVGLGSRISDRADASPPRACARSGSPPTPLKPC